MTTEHVFELWIDREFKRQVLEYIDGHQFANPEKRSLVYAAVWAGLGRTCPDRTTAHYLRVAQNIAHRELVILKHSQKSV